MDRVRTGLLAALAAGLAGSITLGQGAALALGLLWIAPRLRPGSAPRAGSLPLLWPLAAFAGATALSALASGHPGESLWAARDLVFASVVWSVAAATAGPGEGNRLLSWIAVACAVAAVAGVLQVAACPDPMPSEGLGAWFFRRCDRARGFFSIYMTLGGVLALALLGTLPRLLPGGGGRWWIGPVWGTLLAGLAATYVRGAWLGLGAGALALLPWSRRGRLLLAGGLVLLIAGALVGPAALSARLRSLVDPSDPTARERISMWRSGIAMWGDAPWLGVGPGEIKRLYPTYALPDAVKQRTSHLHSAPLQVLAERGIVGFVAWGWIWVAFYWHAARALRRLPTALGRERALVAGGIAAVTGFLVHGLTEHTFGDSETALVAWTIMGLALARAGATSAWSGAR